MKAKVWEKIRPKVKKEFEDRGLTWCEQCGTNSFLTFAHRLKRRFITTEEEMAVVALLCITCHTKLEHSSHEHMYDVITSIIENRK